MIRVYITMLLFHIDVKKIRKTHLKLRNYYFFLPLVS